VKQYSVHKSVKGMNTGFYTVKCILIQECSDHNVPVLCKAAIRLRSHELYTRQ